MIVGTAGHIDHGKTTLVKALTGVDCDRLKEEKARGITLDLGYAYSSDGSLGFVDVPGHERLVHNMLAGATGIDYVLLVVAADDGPMPQTREHLAIADLLGLTRGAVALTKIDAVDAVRRAAVQQEIAALLAPTALAGAPVFPVSAKTGEGVASLTAALQSAALATPARPASGGFRLAIDRAFHLAGAGLVVTGTAFAGSVRVGDTVCISPPGWRARVRNIHAQDRASETGQVGQRIALNLVGDFGKEDIARGMWVLDSALHAPVRSLHARIRLLPSEAPLAHWTQAHLHVGTEDVVARIALLEGDTLAPGESMLAELLLERPVGALHGDRFILRDVSAQRSLGGGQVLDIFPPTRHKRAASHLAYLRALGQHDPREALAQALERHPAGLDLHRFALNRHLDAPSAQALWDACALVRVGEGVQAVGFSPAHWKDLGERVLKAARAEHERAPDMVGVERDRLRRLSLAALSRPAFDRLVAELLADGRLQAQGNWLHLPTHRAELNASDADLWRTLQPLLEAVRFNPPRVREIANATGVSEGRVRELLKRAARVGQVYPVAHDHYFSAAAVGMLAAILEDLGTRPGGVRAADLRDAIGGGRKVAIHILEFFDRVGYTRRQRDAHCLRPGASIRSWTT